MKTPHKRYTVRYYVKDKPVLTAVGSYAELTDLLKGDAKDCFMETKINEGMPPTMHNLIADHNKKTLSHEDTTGSR